MARGRVQNYIPSPVPLGVGNAELRRYLGDEFSRIRDTFENQLGADYGGMRVLSPSTLSVSATPQPIPMDAPLISRNIDHDPVAYSLTPRTPINALVAYVGAFDVQQQTILTIEVYVGGVPTGISFEIEIIQQQDREDVTLLSLAEFRGLPISFFISSNVPRTISLLTSTAVITEV